MIYKELPNTNIKLSQLIFGAFAIGGWFWGGSNENDALEAITIAIDNGVSSIDTAPIYGMGQSEEIVGKAIKGKRDKIQILTKCGMRWNIAKGDFAFDSFNNKGTPLKIYKFNGKESILYECEQSLRRLNTDYIDLYQMHWPESTTPIEETMEAMQLLLQQGKIRAIGVCNCPPNLLQRALKVCNVSTNQVAYNLINRGIESEVVPFCLRHNIGILSHSSLQKGLLTGKIRPGHKFNDGDHRVRDKYFKLENHNQIMIMLGQLEAIAENKKISLTELALTWVAQQPGITAVLVGARNKQQMLDNVKAIDIELSQDEITIINNSFKKLNLI